MRSPDAIRAQVALMSLVPRYSAEIGAALEATTLPDVPAVVITAGRRDRVPEEYVASITDSHERLASRFPRGRLVVADRASHQVPFDDPTIIVDAIRSVDEHH